MDDTPLTVTKKIFIRVGWKDGEAHVEACSEDDNCDLGDGDTDTDLPYFDHVIEVRAVMPPEARPDVSDLPASATIDLPAPAQAEPGALLEILDDAGLLDDDGATIDVAPLREALGRAREHVLDDPDPAAMPATAT